MKELIELMETATKIIKSELKEPYDNQRLKLACLSLELVSQQVLMIRSLNKR